MNTVKIWDLGRFGDELVITSLFPQFRLIYLGVSAGYKPAIGDYLLIDEDEGDLVGIIKEERYEFLQAYVHERPSITSGTYAAFLESDPSWEVFYDSGRELTETIKT